MSLTARELCEWDWVVTSTWRVLHHCAELDDPAEFEKDAAGSGRTSCGLQSERLSIPGLFTRMGAPRCRRCCARVGYPQGVGSPKNDDACRPLVESTTGGGGEVSAGANDWKRHHADEAEKAVEHQLAEICARAEAATPGPWEAREYEPGSPFERWGVNGPKWQVCAVWENWADAEFIAHARTDVLTLLAALEEAERARERVRQQIREQP